MTRRLVALLMFLAAPVAFAADGYYRFPALFADTLVFTAEGDLWQVAASGGRAMRLTTHAGLESHAAFSPDGRQVAFSATYEGPTEVYVMATSGGPPKRLTWFGGRALVAGWTPEGEVMFQTTYFEHERQLQLAAVSPETGVIRRIPLARAREGAWLDRDTLVFTFKGMNAGDNLRQYRGGAAGSVWRFSLASGKEAVALTSAKEGSSTAPMAWGNRIAFLSDRDGVNNLWSMDRDGKDLRQHTRHRDFEVRRASLSRGRVAYQHGADLRLLDLASGQDLPVPIDLVSDFDQLRERWIRKPLDTFNFAHLSANGERVAITARGHVATAGIGTLRRVDLALPRSSRARNAVFMPDGKSVLAICDAGGEYELWLLPADGSGPGKMLTKDADALRWAAWPSPDGKWIVHHDIRQRLWLHEVATGKSTLLDQALQRRDDSFSEVSWAPNSQALAARVEAPGQGEVSQIVLYRVSDRTKSVVTTDRYVSRSPVFSPDGKWLWFVSRRHFEPLVGFPWGNRNMGPHFDKRGRIYALALQPGNRFPFQPKDELEMPERVEPPKAESDKSTPPAQPATEARKDAKKPEPKIPAIAWEGLVARLHEVPLPPGNYAQIAADAKRLWYLEEETAPQPKATLKSAAIDNAGLPPETFAPEVREFQLSANGRKVMIRKWAASGPGDIFIADAAAKPPTEWPRHQVKLADWQFPIRPRDEWRQLFADAWRLHREHFYDRDLHGIDWPATRRKYEALLPRVTDRWELADLMAQQSAELSVLHTQVGAGDVRRGEDNVLPATLGAALARHPDGVRIERIYRGDPELVSELPPLARASVGAKVGEVIVSVDGIPVTGVSDITVLLRGKADKQVLLVLKDTNGNRRSVVVVPAPDAREARFKRTDWEWERRRRVEEASKGRYGYLSLRAMGAQNLADFAREFYPVVEREGLVIDVRHNDGGSIDSIVIEKLMRRAWAYWQSRDGRHTWNMQNAFRGKIVVLISEHTYSAGETFAEGMRRLGLGTLVGTRTAGAGIWLSDRNRLADGGIARSPEFGQVGMDGAWLIEGEGVAPDIEVENLPHAAFGGQDAQLDAAIKVLDEALARDPVSPLKKAPYPRKAP